MAFTVQRTQHEMIVRQRAPGAPLLLGACIYGAAAWFLLGDSEIADAAQSLEGVAWLLNLSVLLAGVVLACVGVMTVRHPVDVVLDRARNGILVRFQPGARRLDFEGSLHEVAGFDLVDVETAVYSSLVRADRQSPAPTGAGALAGVKEWAFRTASEQARFEAEHSIGQRFGRSKPVRLRVTMRNGEEIMLDRLTASPENLTSLARSLEQFRRGAG